MLLSTLTIVSTVVAFAIIIMLLVSVLLTAKAKLAPSGPVRLTINGEQEVEVESGSTLLSTLGNNKIFLPSACGGGGTCAMCKCQVMEGGGEILPTEKPRLDLHNSHVEVLVHLDIPKQYWCYCHSNLRWHQFQQKEQKPQR